MPDRFEYRQGATYVGSTIQDLLDAGAGVCQDFVHLGLVLLRRHGIAARYVSGYLWAAPQAGGSDSVEVETHAWLEALLPGGGKRGEPVWVGVDPTNRRLAGETHVKIGHGRTYADVPPVKGVYRGPEGRARRGGDDDAPGSAGQRARLSAAARGSVGTAVSSSPSSPLNPHPASPVEMQERINAEREGKPFLLLRDGAGRSSSCACPPTASG